MFGKCTKCNGHRIIGPTYVTSLFGRGKLKFRCYDCGWHWYEPTKDHEAVK